MPHSTTSYPIVLSKIDEQCERRMTSNQFDELELKRGDEKIEYVIAHGFIGVIAMPDIAATRECVCYIVYVSVFVSFVCLVSGVSVEYCCLLVLVVSPSFEFN